MREIKVCGEHRVSFDAKGEGCFVCEALAPDTAIARLRRERDEARGQAQASNRMLTDYSAAMTACFPSILPDGTRPYMNMMRPHDMSRVIRDNAAVLRERLKRAEREDAAALGTLQRVWSALPDDVSSPLVDDAVANIVRQRDEALKRVRELES